MQIVACASLMFNLAGSRVPTGARGILGLMFVIELLCLDSLFVCLYERHVGIWCRGMNLGQWFDVCNRTFVFFANTNKMWSLTGGWFLDVSMAV